MSLIAATQITAIATAVLAAFAIVTAAFAYLAFRKQSTEVTTLQQQFENQRKVNEEQTKVLGLQAEELNASLKQRKREAAEHHRAQASRIFIELERGSDIRVGQAQVAAGAVRGETVTARVRNTSELPVYNPELRWHEGGSLAPLPINPEPLATLMPGADDERTQPIRPGADPSQFGAIFRFREANETIWDLDSEGRLLSEVADTTS
jgi:hypothetical protein